MGGAFFGPDLPLDFCQQSRHKLIGEPGRHQSPKKVPLRPFDGEAPPGRDAVGHVLGHYDLGVKPIHFMVDGFVEDLNHAFPVASGE